ncbi:MULTISPECIES: hypothetical protein [unclassified Mycobacterium]|uniref:hypothetical protein n=1 Tax=unclassified Mycobacterium TaxID=2642494 RepID=UPI00089D741C|nr:MULTISPECIES: hypothetical protein [unclassified Mycobacterium]SEB02471.1 hypothetical protein SAMN04488580_10697 [Mycobacterium sp. 283mftsu]
MRDHRAAARVLRRRHMHVAGRLRAVERIFALCGRMSPTVNMHAHQHVSGHVTVALTAVRHSHISPVAVVNVSRPPATPAVRVSEVQQGRARQLHLLVTRIARTEISNAATGEQRRLAIVTTRRETRVPSVACVVPKAAVSPPESRADDRTRWPATQDEALPILRPQPQVTGPTPGELATITNHVLTAIDRRLIAHNERLGRG